MREIKFRGYAIDEMVHSQWLYGFGVLNIDYVDDTEECHLCTLYTLNGVYEVEPDSVGQYTGKKDKNGVEIYEGDIDGCDDELMYVAYEDGSFGLKYLNPTPGNEDYFDNYIDWGAVEIIGNIYEHLQWLEGDSDV